MIYVLIKYYQTKNDKGAGRNTPWSANTVVWPTYMLAAASGVTLVTTIFALFALCCGKAKGNERKSKIWTTVLKYAIHVISWLIIAVLYRVFKTGDDLWGWSCSDRAKAIQFAFKSDLDFSALCNIQVSASNFLLLIEWSEPLLNVIGTLQTSSWYFSIVEVVAKVIFALGHFFAHRKKEKNAGWKLAGDLVGIGADQVGP